MPTLADRVSRARFLARVAAGLPVVERTARLIWFTSGTAAAGLLATFVALRLTRAPAGSETGPVLAPAIAGVLVASLTGGLLFALTLRRFRKEQAAEFARVARRLGEEKTALAELRVACKRLSVAIERAVPEVIAEDDSADTWSAGAAGELGLDAFAQERDNRRAGRLLRVARAAAFFGGTDLELKRLALAGPCAEVIEQYRRLAGPEREVLYIEDGGGDWLSAPIDRPLFVLAFRETLDNVLEHSGDWSRITVTTEPVAGAIVLRVRDDGRGIAPEAVREIVSGRAPAYRGGLGLSLVRAVVEAHGGHFRMESQPGHGTTVTMKFPTHA